MLLFCQQLINGILLGAMFALMSIGLSMVFGIMKTANFAYGALYMVGGYVAYWSATLLGFPYPLAAAAAFVVMFVIGAVVEAGGFAPFRGNEDATLMFGLGLALLLRGGAILAWGSQARYLGFPWTRPIMVGPFIFPPSRLFAGLASFVIIGLVYLIVARTRWGRITRAVADNSVRARLLGVNARTQYWLASGLGTGLAAIACVFLMPAFNLSPTVGENALFIGFAVVIIGGLGSVVGCAVGGVILGIVTALAFSYTDATIAPAFPLLLLILTLMVRPEGLFGSRRRLA